MEKSVLARNAMRASAFTRPCSAQHAPRKTLRANPENRESDSFDLEYVGRVGAAGLLAPLLLDVQSAFAQNREYGIIEGQIASLYHPAIMLFLFGSSVYAAWLGFQWR